MFVDGRIDGRRIVPISPTSRRGGTVSTPVDLRYRSSRILIRRVDGIADLTRRSAMPSVVPSDTHALPLVVTDEPGPVSVLKARRPDRPAADPARRSSNARFDIVLDTHPDIVFLDVYGDWNADVEEARIPNLADQIARRLRRFAWHAPYRCRPSLCYETGEHPERVQIEITTVCNLRCGYCTNRLLAERAHAPLARVERMLAQVDLARVSRVDLTGLGESLLHPELPAIVRAIRQRNAACEIGIVTNGTQATLARCQSLLDAGLTSIAVSVDTLDAERFARARAGGRLDVVLEHVTALAASRRTSGRRFALYLKAVLQDEAWPDVNALVAFSVQHRLDRPVVSPLDGRASTVRHYPPDVRRNTPIPSWSDIKAFVNDRWPKETGVGDTAAVGVTARRDLPWVNQQWRPVRGTCDWVTDSAFIGHDGTCLACCEQIGDLPRPGLGSVLERTMAELWNDELLYGYRLPLAAGIIPAGCLGCDMAPAASVYS
jgi:organic radical activating enzyme